MGPKVWRVRNWLHGQWNIVTWNVETWLCARFGHRMGVCRMCGPVKGHQCCARCGHVVNAGDAVAF